MQYSTITVALVLSPWAACAGMGICLLWQGCGHLQDVSCDSMSILPDKKEARI